MYVMSSSQLICSHLVSNTTTYHFTNANLQQSTTLVFASYKARKKLLHEYLRSGITGIMFLKINKNMYAKSLAKARCTEE